MDQIAATYGLTKRYKDFCAVSQLDMTVREGRIYGFLGPNGAGKSTTLKMLLGLVQPSAGSIELMGKPMNGRNRIELLRSTGSLIESPSFYGHLTARENLRIYTTLLGLPEKNIDEALKIVRLDRQEGKRLSAYSLGMKQRFGIASAMLGFPKLLILDEPTNGLDPVRHTGDARAYPLPAGALRHDRYHLKPHPQRDRPHRRRHRHHRKR